MASTGQGLLTIAMLVVLAVFLLAMIYRIFTMTPAYIYQRSIYFIFKYNPQLVAQGLAMVMGTILNGFAREYSLFLLREGILLQLHILQGYTITPTSLTSRLASDYETIINMLYTPTGLAVPRGQGNYTVNIGTNYYGALRSLSYVYSGNNKSSIYVSIGNIYDMPILGVSGLRLSSTLNLTATLSKPSICLGNTHPFNYTATTRCVFDFTKNTYTCTGPGFTKTGRATDLWAPWYYAVSNGKLTLNSSGWVDSSNDKPDPIILMYPIDEVTSNSGVKVSAVFRINAASNFMVGVNILAQYPSRDSSTGVPITYKGTSKAPSTLNVTIVMKCGSVCTPFSGSSVTISYSWYNGTKLINSGSVGYPLPMWVPVPPSKTQFNDFMYIYSSGYSGYKVGSWLVMLIQGATLVNATITLNNTYTLFRNAYVSVSLNNQPAVGALINLLNVSMNKPPIITSINYTVCNITSSAIVFNVTMPKPSGYPNNQYLLVINYSGIVTVINPWLRYMIIPRYSCGSSSCSGIGTLNNYTATSMVAYQAVFYNMTSGTWFIVPYIANTGIPALLTIYNSTSIYVYYGSNTYIMLTSISTFNSLNIYPSRSADLLIYTLRETLIHLPPGYLVLRSTPKIPPSTGITPPNQAPMPTRWLYLPSQTLSYVYTNSTLVNWNQYTNGYSSPPNNYALYYRDYRIGSIAAWAYCSIDPRDYNSGCGGGA